MQHTAILYPVFVQVALTFYLALCMDRERRAALESGAVKTSDIALGERAWPPRATQLANAYQNQFELPVLFYVLAAYAMITSRVDIVMMVLAWVFVITRLWHGRIHTTHNNVRQRYSVFLVSAAVLLIMWIYFAASILIAGVA
jgi:hypothetical protein